MINLGYVALGLGDPFTGRDAAARTFSHIFTLETPRDPDTWPHLDARSVPGYHADKLAFIKGVSTLGKVAFKGLTLGKVAFKGLAAFAHQHNLDVPGLPNDPDADLEPEQVVQVLNSVSAMLFPQLAANGPG